MANPSPRWDQIPVYGWWQTAPGVPASGTIEFLVPDRIRRSDGRMIYPAGAKVVAQIGNQEQQNAAARSVVRQAMRARDETLLGGAFDGTAWDVEWDASLNSAIFTYFYLNDDPDITPNGWQVKVAEKLTAGGGREYYIETPQALLLNAVPGLNLGAVEVPPGSPSVPAPIYAKGQPGGVAPLDADGDVVDASGTKILAGGGASPVDVAVADVTGLTLALAGKQPAGEYVSDAELAAALETATAGFVTSAQLTNELIAKQNAGDYATTTALTSGLATKQPTGDYATTGALTTGLAGKQASGDYATNAAVTSASTADRARGNHSGTQSADTVVDGTTNKAYTAAEKTKLAGVAPGATALALGTAAGTAAAGNDARLSDARAPLTHTHTADQIAETTAVKMLSATERTKLAGVATGATANTVGTTAGTVAAGDDSRFAAVGGATPRTFTGTEWRAGTIAEAGLTSPAAISYAVNAALDEDPLGWPTGSHYYNRPNKEYRIKESSNPDTWVSIGALTVDLMESAEQFPTTLPATPTLYFRKKAV